MGSDHIDNQALRYPGEWVATAHGRVIAHGPDFAQVAQEACGKARDIAFEHIPDPGAPLWRPVRPAAGPPPRPVRRRPLFVPRSPGVGPSAPGSLSHPGATPFSR